MSEWNIEDALATYNVSQWGDGYFGISQQGQLEVYPNPARPNASIDIKELTKELEAENLSLPVLVRFPDIIRDRVTQLGGAFHKAMAQFEYKATFTAVYPIKVNQQRRVVEEFVASQKNSGDDSLAIGLEAGSKPELLAVLAMGENACPVIVCNGYKDREYIRYALMGEKLGYRVYIVIEKLSELDLVIEESKALNVTPRLGVRVRLSTVGKGNWQNTGGEKSKFGLSARQLLILVDKLKQNKLLNNLELLHFHLGSQIANIKDIKNGLAEVSRFYVELSQLGAVIKCVDVGGGLGVDYEGTQSRSYCSMNYSMQEYASNIVSSLKTTCTQNGLPEPDIITESGRAMTAHHAILLANIIDSERLEIPPDLQQPKSDAPSVLKDLWQSYRQVNAAIKHAPVVEVYHDVMHDFAEAQSQFSHGLLNLSQRAYAEQVYIATCKGISGRLKKKHRVQYELANELDEKLADKLFVNFSLFQSLPDIWGIDQIFPIMPIEGLGSPCDRRAVIQDITCDSDGRIEQYVDSDGIESTLPIPNYDPEKPFVIAFCMIGAYQEILGDMHNLFGDTHSVDVELTDDGYQLVDKCEGDTVDHVLRYVKFDPEYLLASYRRQVSSADLSVEEANTCIGYLSQGLKSYTYLSEK